MLTICGHIRDPCNGVVAGSVWCFPLAGPLIDSTDLRAGLGAGITTTSALRVVTGSGADAAPLSSMR